ncbi:MAG: hypothetical protein JRM80_09060 [Nitrososphaerota archaeon]|nr:hypothetical protein [Nitrososphaerota archaeon]MDG6959811.1 hypothetical protein [Nitrososphaerota archaeon]MDG6973142.1 hypothetical protein [Nitrososphaerota archaeon]MDG7015039.1 hypothetical protein [Nitrososphaerota archaeon]WGO50991.1 MAG: hypothetical protein JRM93_02975 [Nitrososphaerota archaeon]
MDLSPRSRRKRAISGIIGAVILFTMLFTIGTEYFIFVNNTNNLETQSLVNRGNAIATKIEENIGVTASLSPKGYLQFYYNDTGGQAVNITSIMVLSSSGAILDCYGVSLPSSQSCGNTTPALPQVANPGAGAPRSGYIVTGYSYSTGSVIIKLLASDGSVFTSTYPPNSVSLASQALSSGAIGDLYLTFHSFTYYVITGCDTSTSSYCLGTSGSGFVIPAGVGDIGFAVSMTNLNPEHDSIVLDQFTLIYQNSFYGNAHQNFVAWYVVSNQSNNIDNTYAPIVLAYDIPTTVVFASSQCISASSGPNDCSGNAFAVGSSPSSAYTISANFIISHGWEAPPPVSLSSLSYSKVNYGQDAPFVSTLYT